MPYRISAHPLLFLLLLPFLFIACSGEGGGPRTTSSLTLKQALDGIQRVRLEIDAGSITVQSEAVDSIVVAGNVAHRGDKGSARLQGQVRDGVLVISATSRDGGELSEGRYVLTVPPGMALRLTNKQGSIAVNGHAASVKATVQKGSITVTLVKVPAKGDIDLRNTEGSVMLTLPRSGVYAFEAVTTEGSVRVEGLENVRWSTNEAARKVGETGPRDASRRTVVKAYNIKGSVMVNGK